MVIYTDPLYSPFPNWSSCCRSTIYEFDGVSWYQSSGQKSTAFGQQNLCPKLLFTVHRRFFSGRCRIPDVGKELVTTHWVFHTKHSNILKAGDFCFDMWWRGLERCVFPFFGGICYHRLDCRWMCCATGSCFRKYCLLTSLVRVQVLLKSSVCLCHISLGFCVFFPLARFNCLSSNSFQSSSDGKDARMFFIVQGVWNAQKNMGAKENKTKLRGCVFFFSDPNRLYWEKRRQVYTLRPPPQDTLSKLGRICLRHFFLSLAQKIMKN